MSPLKYPLTAKADQVDDYHGTRVADPYRWLEDTDAPETNAWTEAQNELTFGFLEAIPEREKIKQRLTELWDYPKASAPFSRAGRYFQFKNTGLQNQDVLFVQQGIDEAARELIDPNALSQDGTVALTNLEVSKDGHWLAYATSASGSDWMTWRVRDVNTGQDLADEISWSKFSGASWKPDHSGFYYSRYEAPEPGKEFESANYYQKLYFHRLGQVQAADELVYQRLDHKDWGINGFISEDGRYLIISLSEGTDVRNRLFYHDLQGSTEVVELIPDLEAEYAFVGNDGSVFYLRTNLDAPRGRLIAVDTLQPAKSCWRTLIPQAEDTLEMVQMVNHQFVCMYLQDAHHALKRYGQDGSFLGAINLPMIGSVVSLNGQREDEELFYAFQSFACPTTIYRYDFRTDTSQVLFTPPIQFDFSPYVTRQVFVTSKDGARLPMFLVQRKDIPSTPQPTVLYGYGGFNISMTPSFSISRLAWLEMGGVYAWAILRGGGEYGEEWHQAGMKDRKQNVFDDFIACAEYLAGKGITTPAKLAIQGGSNGGLLVGACMTQRPELFGAALPAVGVMDMLRFHKFTIGWAWVSDYGSAEDPEEFRYLVVYSPLHNLRPGTHYPATLITTSDHDDRVVPGHSFKFAAALQAAQAGDAPVLIRIQKKAGHGMGKPTAILIQEQADIWAFLCRVLQVGS
jgi:prolyl oligopeptidase